MVDVLLEKAADVNVALQNASVNALCVLVANKDKLWTSPQQIKLASTRMIPMVILKFKIEI